MPTISTLTVDVESRTSGFSRGLKIAVGGLAALATGAAFAFKKFEESENVLQQTEAVLTSTGGAANVSAKQVDSLADAISHKAGVDDEAIQSGLNMLLTFKNIRNETGKGNDIFNQASVAITDVAAGFAAASGSAINMKGATLQLGKALNDPIAGMSSLTRVGIQFSEQQQNQITRLVEHNDLLGAQKVILAEVTSQFAGSAEAQATASGKVQVAFENLVETIGAKLAPVITVVLAGIEQFAQFLEQKVGPALQAVWAEVKPVAEIVGNVLGPAFEIAWHAVRDRLLPALEKLAPIFKLIGLAVVAFATVLGVQIAVVITVISHVIDIIGKIVDAFMKVVGWVRENLAEPIVGALQRVGEWISRAAEWIKDRFLAAWNAIKGPVLAVIGAIVAAVEGLIRVIDAAANALHGLVGEKGFVNVPPLPGAGPPGGVPAQHGGIFTRPTHALIGEAGPEAVIPLDRLGGMIGGDIILNVDGRELARITRNELNRLAGRNATSGLR